MVLVVKIGVEDDEFFEVWGCAEERDEYFSNLLSIPMNITDIYRPQCVKRGTFPQLLEHWSERIHLNPLLAKTKAFKTLLLKQNPRKQLRVVITSCPLWIAADVEPLDLDLCIIDSLQDLTSLLSRPSDPAEF